MNQRELLKSSSHEGGGERRGAGCFCGAPPPRYTSRRLWRALELQTLTGIGATSAPWSSPSLTLPSSAYPASAGPKEKNNTKTKMGGE